MLLKRIARHIAKDRLPREARARVGTHPHIGAIPALLQLDADARRQRRSEPAGQYRVQCRSIERQHNFFEAAVGED